MFNSGNFSSISASSFLVFFPSSRFSHFYGLFEGMGQDLKKMNELTSARLSLFAIHDVPSHEASGFRLECSSSRISKASSKSKFRLYFFHIGLGFEHNRLE